MKENLVYNINRLLVGLLIIFAISLTYFFNLDIFLYFTVSTLIFYEFYKSIIKNKFFIIFLFVLFILLFLSFNFFINNIFFLIILTLISFLFSVFVNKYFNFFFSLFVINVIILISNIYVIDRSIIYFIILISFFNDTVAYLIGSYFKGPLISPKISPKKTWSGTSVSFCFTLLILIFFDYNLFIASFMAISLFFGDIYFSYIKRNLNIKDFSSTLSTHGGILDRLDSITFLVIIFGILNI